MALVITVAQQKGGAGKTMLAANLAAAMASARRVCLLDIDPQRSLTRWHDIRSRYAKPLPAIGFSDVSGWRLRAELDRLAASHDAVIIDTPPQVDTEAKLAIRAAGLVLVPLQPSPPDLWAAQGTVQLARAEGRPLRLVLNRAPAASRLRSQVEREAAAAGYEILTSTIGNRAGFANAFAQGLGVTEASPKSQAAAELRAVLAEIEKLTR
ncbi:AAA family ATPase [Acidisoma cellulosilytica]|uniref:AAA family ATPase n=1 Tax=Acidisoma cellulosilyticum TaxID=2802395 RepID=A0A963Z0Y8_9PROT|nr:ParA family partition ATPase [Acidisoma cellulosilyticum]MCB8879833.1 AAA family ATPase [Acidisoma cellulosilyticum]